jgi:hypothetical protein
MAVLIPVYLTNYGPTNFLYFCDIAMLLTLAGIWSENRLPVSLPGVGILIPQALLPSLAFVRALPKTGADNLDDYSASQSINHHA